MTKNSKTLSSDAESLMPGCTIGEMSRMSPRVSLDSTDSLACIQPRLPRIVLISPLWQSSLNGCARLHVGKVFVLKRLWTRARPLVK